LVPVLAKKRRWLWCVALVALVAGGCGRLGRVKLVDRQTAVAQRNAVLFFVDGVDWAVYRQMLTAGELPNIQRYLVARGASVERMVTVVPSITYAVTTTFVTGLVPGHHGILGNKFFDRDRLLYVDYNTTETYRDLAQDFIAPTIYEILDDKFSVTIQTPLRRGAYRRIDNWASSGIRWFFNQITEIDCLTAERFERIGKIARKAQRWPEFIFAYMPATDEMGHRYGPNSRRYRSALKNVDEQIGRICKALADNGLLEHTYLVFLSDHGMAACPKKNFINLAELLRNKFSLRLATKGPGRRTNYSKRAEYFRKYDAVLCTGGERRAILYFKGSDNWAQPSEPARVRAVADSLGSQEAICLVAYQDRAGVVVQNGLGRALIERHERSAGKTLDEKLYRYSVIDGRDPLGYAEALRGNNLLDGDYHDGRAWLAGTIKSDYPDLPVQLSEMFDSKRAGDLAVFAAVGWDFSRRQIGGHGSVLAVDMLAPMVVAGAGIIPGHTIEMARTVDLAPTLIEMLDDKRAGQYHFDGRSLLGEMSQE